MAVKGDELAQYIVERVMTYFETPREERQRLKKDKREHREPRLTLWFGMLPLSLQIWFSRKNGKRNTPT
ncbi:YqzE family protein [Ferviditalea candida]|uniref:YqzE family protein n=1 Tax=Ferviditalea candida TaxID=3108399 RepID=A0ABU5ZCD7_9BACL|nr:YqzE family protein [Paenibacillaceae bacterium T2]